MLNCDWAVTFGIAGLETCASGTAFVPTVLAAVEIQRDCAATAVEIVLGAGVEIFGTVAAENCDFSFVDFPPFQRSCSGSKPHISQYASQWLVERWPRSTASTAM